MTDNKKSPALNTHDLRELKNQLHHLKPAVVITEAGLTNAVFQDIEQALVESELIKIRTNASSSEELTTIADEICAKVKAVLVQTMGYIIAVYRKNVLVEEQQ